jgi:hypothetical protein
MITIPLLADGKWYTLEGIGKIKLYPIAKVAQRMVDEDIPRDTQTIRKWELYGILPPTPFRINNKRLYCEEQINAIVEAAKEAGIRQGVDIDKTDFKVIVKEKLDRVINKLIK